MKLIGQPSTASRRPSGAQSISKLLITAPIEAMISVQKHLDSSPVVGHRQATVSKPGTESSCESYLCPIRARRPFVEPRMLGPTVNDGLGRGDGDEVGFAEALGLADRSPVASGESVPLAHAVSSTTTTQLDARSRTLTSTTPVRLGPSRSHELHDLATPPDRKHELMHLRTG